MAPDEVALAKVIRLMDGPIALALACVSLNYYERCEDCKEEECGSAARNGAESRDAQLSILEHRSLQGLDLNPTSLIGIVCERLNLQA